MSSRPNAVRRESRDPDIPASVWFADAEAVGPTSPNGEGVMLTNSRDIIRRLLQDGFEQESIRGSHHKFVHPVSRRVVIVPHPRKDIPPGTVRSIYKAAGWQKD
jgi:predicted RNA binding protein YcfA (HicA-like mRNA interferase family)